MQHLPQAFEHYLGFNFLSKRARRRDIKIKKLKISKILEALNPKTLTLKPEPLNPKPEPQNLKNPKTEPQNPKNPKTEPQNLKNLKTEP